MKKINNLDLLTTSINDSNISQRFSSELLPYFELFSFEKGDFIIRQGFCSDYLYFIIEGKVRVYSYTPSGNITLLSFCDGYETLGDSASLWEKKLLLMLKLSLMESASVFLLKNIERCFFKILFFYVQLVKI